MHTVTVTAFFEAVGYYLRIYSGQNTDNLNAYIPTALLLLLPPLVLAVASYRTLAHAMRESGIKTGKRAIKTIENAFLYLDILAFLTQASGSGLLAIQSMANTGNKIAIAGMAISCCNFLVFAGTIYMIHRAVIREAPEFYQSNLRPVFLALYLNIIGLNIRSIYRLIEFADGFFGYVNTHEVFFLIFDTLLIFLCVCTWIAFPPGKYLTGNSPLESPSQSEENYYNLEVDKAEVYTN
ncbi:RTA-like protein [Umbelopsis sp. PMI_123]|nr:RTA-like protein [Umbelopsis sp. PMI_123]